MTEVSRRHEQPLLKYRDGVPDANFEHGLHDVLIPELGEPERGKVGNIWNTGDGKLVIVRTDRKSVSDVVVGAAPYVGQVLTMTSEYWFDETKDIVRNHVLAVPHENVIIAEKAQNLGVEFVLREYMAESSTSTSVFKNYQEGKRVIYGIEFPDGLRPNERFPFDDPIVTPTTKAANDEMMTEPEARALVDTKFGQGTYDKARFYAQRLYARGRSILSERGLILVDTKFEFGIDKNGEIILIDELLTPDSSRFWKLDTYQMKFEHGETPDTFDKEILRRALAEMGWKKGQPVPVIDPALFGHLSNVYHEAYMMITGKQLQRRSTTFAKIRDAVLSVL